MEYMVVEDDEKYELEKRIETYMKSGWVCQGGMSTSITSEDEVTFYQAMIRSKVKTK